MVKPYYQDNLRTVYNKDCRSMAELPDNSVQCVVTSPPYWGLRKYSGEQDLIWGGDVECKHEWEGYLRQDERYTGKRKWQHIGVEAQEKGMKVRDVDPNAWGHPQVASEAFCSLCGAWRGAFGLEPTPELYVQHTVEILREIRRVLRKDGVVFWNIGDSYAGNREKATKSATATRGNTVKDVCAKFKKISGSLKPKDLCLLPFRVAIAAQEDGWWVRSDIIWSKPNPMPESVTDRPTNSHEYILMLTKRARYYWDADAVREPVAPSTIGRGPVDFGGSKGREYQPEKDDPNFRNGSKQWGRTFDYRESCANGRNIRSVWEFATQPYPEAHFAVFPEKLPETCIKAATPEAGCCSKCGAPHIRLSDKHILKIRGKTANEKYPATAVAGQPGIDRRFSHDVDVSRETLGWKPGCSCDAGDAVPSIVLDPFAGAGTTLKVTSYLGRKAVGYELSKEYCELIVDRLRQMIIW